MQRARLLQAFGMLDIWHTRHLTPRQIEENQMTATVFNRAPAPRSFSDRALAVITALVTKVGEIYDRNDAAKRSRLSWHYFAA
jgi:hypothetical protein